MKIGICCYPTYGGSGAIATGLGRALADSGHEVHFLSYARPARLAAFHPRVTFHRVQVTSYPLFRYPPYDLALASLMRDVAEDRDLDILHAHYAIPHAVAAVLAREMLDADRPRIVTTLHGTDITIVGTERAYYHSTRFGIRRSDAVTAVSEWLRQETVRVFEPTCNIEVVPNFVDLDRFRPPTTESCRKDLAPEGARVLSHVSNFRPVKRVQDVIRIFAGVAARMDARLVIAGDGPDRGAAEAQASALGVRDLVNFLGEQEGVERVLAASDLFLLPSEHESFGLAALEAMACGVPVIATRSGGLPEVVRDGETGFLLGVGDVDAAVERAIALLEDEPLRCRMGEAARSDAASRFDAPRVVERYVKVYERALAKPVCA